MRILMILREDYPPDVRVAKEASSLVGDGHEVALVCFNRKRRQQREELDGVSVFRLYPWPSIFRKAHSLFNTLPYLNPAWYGFIKRAARQFRAEALHVHDLPLARTAIRAGIALGLPVVFDMHENWAELLPSVPRRFFEKLLATRYTFKAVEVEVCREAAAVLVVVEESKARLVRLGIPADKIHVVPNLVDLRRIPDSLPGREPEGGRVEFLYAGGLSRHRGLDTLLRGFAALASRRPEIFLTIAGAGPEDASLRMLTKRLGLEEKVSFPGWLDFPVYLEMISRCSVGLVPHLSNPHTDATLPHKLFHYMAMKKPVLAGDAAPLKRIVLGEGCGLVVRSGDVGAMVEALSKLSSSDSLRRELGERGFRAVQERYNWGLGVRPLLDLYRRL